MCPSDSLSSDSPSMPGPDREFDVRIDAPHVRPMDAGQVPAGPAGQGHAAAVGWTPSSLAPAGEATAAVQQLRTQAVQLADHLAVRQDELDRREAELDARTAEVESSLRNARLWVSQREADLKQLRQRWIEERRKAEAELDAARERLDQESRRDRADLQEKRRALERRAEDVDRARVALHRVHEEVARMHRETLQMRLANAELRAELGAFVPAEVQQRTLKQIRVKLSEEYRRASEELSRQKQELLAIRHDLAEQHRKLGRERERLHRLAAHMATARQTSEAGPSR